MSEPAPMVEFTPLAEVEDQRPRPSADEQRLSMIDPSGAMYRVPISSAADAESKGWTYPSNAEVRAAPQDVGVVGQAAALATGQLEGLTFGLSSPLVAGAATLGGGMTYEEAAAGVQGLQRDAPISTTIGQLQGGIAQGMLTGGASLAAEGALAARMGGSLAARVGAGALVGAGEGAIQGGLYSASRTMLDGGEITAERLLADAGEGALFGGAIGGGVGAAVPLVAAGAGKLAARATGGDVAEGLASFAEERAAKAAGATGSELRKVGNQADVQAMGRTVLDYRFQGGPRAGQGILQAGSRADDLIEPVEAAVRETGERISAFKGQIDQAIEAQPELAPNARAILDRIDAEITEPLRRGMLIDSADDALVVDRQLSKFRAMVEERETSAAEFAAGQGLGTPMKPITWGDIDQLRAEVGNYVRPKRPKGSGVAAVKPGSEPMDQVYKVLREELNTSADAALRGAGNAAAADAFKAANRTYSHLIDYKKIVEKQATQAIGNRWASPTDYLTGAAMGLGMLMSGNIGGLAFGAGGALAHKVVRERGSSTLALLADRLSKQQGRIDTALSAMARTKAAQTLATRTRGARTAVVAQAGRERERRQESKQATEERFARVHARVTAARDAGPRGRAEMAATVGAPIAEEYPQVAARLSERAMKNLELAVGKLPPALKGKGLQTHLEAPRIPAPEQIRFLDWMQGLEDPVSVIEDVAAGSVNRDSIDAVRQAYPRLWDETRKELMGRVADLEEPLAYDALMPLALAFDFEADARSHGPTISRMQQALVPADPEKAKSPNFKSTIASQTATRQERA